ncbi:MAG TPA: transposase [Clostridia bacterium]|nr:transposase [Clostridia bacterium]
MRSCIGNEWNARESKGSRFAFRPGRVSGLAIEDVRLPLDLREWVGSGTLICWIHEELDRFCLQDFGLTEASYPEPICQPKTLLAILVYAYATETFESEGIEHACKSDTAFRLLCDGTTPYARELTLFRRRNRGLLVTLLVRLFTRALREQFVLGEANLPLGLRHRLHEEAVERLDIARHMDTVDLD